MSSVRGIMFDAVGTIMTPVPSVSVAYHLAGQRHGSQLSRAKVSKRFARSFRNSRTESPATTERGEREFWRTIVADVFDDVPDTATIFDELWRHFAAQTHWRLYDDVHDVWRQLSDRGFTLGIASNFDERLLSICQAHPPLDTCDHVFWSAQMRVRKPSPLFFSRVASHLELEPSQLLMVGDDIENDYFGSQAAGWQSILIIRKPNKQIPAGIPVSNRISGMGELLKMLAMPLPERRSKQ